MHEQECCWCFNDKVLIMCELSSLEILVSSHSVSEEEDTVDHVQFNIKGRRLMVKFTLEKAAGGAFK